MSALINAPVKAAARPDAIQLFQASLIATALVYLPGILIIAALVALTSEGSEALINTLTFLGFFVTFGAGAAGFLGVAIVAPLGTGIGKIILRLSPPGWWQGPLTGALVAVAMVSLTLLAFWWGAQPMDGGLYAMAAVPLALAPLAGAFVQRQFLRWPHKR